MKIFKISTRENKKYMIKSPSGKIVHFGDTRYEQYRDKIGHYKHLDHGDRVRRSNYLKRAMAIKDKNGNLTYKNPESANYYSVRYLW